MSKSSVSFWKKTMPTNRFPRLTKSIETDVVIVGGGISGLTTAYLLKKSGKKVVVIDKDTIGGQGGTTINTTGKITSQHSIIYKSLSDRLGKKVSKLYGLANQTAVEEIKKLVKSEDVDCDFRQEDAYVFTRDDNKVEEFKKEAETAKKHGLPANFVTNSPLPFEIRAAVKFSHQATFHPGKYIASLAKLIDGQESQVFEKTPATGIYDGAPARVIANSHEIVAKDIVVATNVPTFPLIARGAYCILEYPQNSYIVAGKIDRKIKGMHISTDPNEHSILPVRSGGEELILIGGQNHIPGTAFDAKRRYKRLAQYAMERFGIKEISFKWYARDYQAYDNIPLVGKMYPWSKHLYVITAFQKWGLSNSMVSGMIIRDTIMGEQNEWAQIYNPVRLSPITSIPRVFMQYVAG